MKTNIVLRAVLLLASTLAVAAMLFACTSDSGPESREFELTIKDGKLDLDFQIIEVIQGDTVTLNIDADEHGTFHLHGYDIEIDLGPEQTATMEFAAHATGKFSITFHPGAQKHEEDKKDSGDGHDDEEGEEITIASLEVQPR